MQYRTLGRTGWRVSLLGLGSGGTSRLGQRYDLSMADTQRLLHVALDAGVNLIDTAPGYAESETILGQALSGVSRDRYYLCTKFMPVPPRGSGPMAVPGALRASLEQSLARLRTDCIDLFYLHAVTPTDYDQVRERFLPELVAAREAGLIRELGISEAYQSDHEHAMAPRAIRDGEFAAIMVGLNVLSPAAVTTVLPVAEQEQVGIVVMCAVRNILTDTSSVATYVRQWQQQGLLDADADQVDPEHALDWLLGKDGPDIVSAAYRFAAAPPQVSTVLTGTGRLSHFEANLRAILAPPLPAETFDRVLSTFGPIRRNVQPLAAAR